jgi:processive 1,2-diacylglycerol beta-glucosyltransferase
VSLARVLILSASAGAGHVRAAQALEKAFHQGGTVREVRHVDVLQHTSALFRRIYGQGYLDLVSHAPEVLGWLYDYLDRPWKHERLRLAFESLNTRPFVKLLTATRPDWVVCTHFLPAEIVAWLRARERLEARQAVVVTDFDVHALWLVRQVERYFVALEETRVHLTRLGIPAERITVSGIPIDPVFAEPKDRRAMRLRHALDPDRTTVLVSAGGFGVGPVEHLVRSLQELRHRAQVVVICGRGADLRRRVRRVVAAVPKNSPVTFTVVGYTRREKSGFARSAAVGTGRALLLGWPPPRRAGGRPRKGGAEHRPWTRRSRPGAWWARTRPCGRSTRPSGGWRRSGRP